MTLKKLVSPTRQFAPRYVSGVSEYEGSFEVDGERLTATYTWQGDEEVYVFRIIDGETLEFVKDESTDIPLENGVVFKAAK